ncbi:MAG: L,D-transpeptidase family protein [Gammaproteobacteria bacterium]|nr:L,D-transpeptidase family protein [Gammaproteobacteria bacterium]
MIHKSQRTLSLVSGTDAVRTYPIRLGARPSGHKRQAGDERTPEERYFVEYKNSSSRFFLSLKISYPNRHDALRARTAGLPPGNNIMIHGMPGEPRFDEAYYRNVDWTDGCIAVSNAAMQEIWMAVKELTPVVIYP